MNTSIHDVDTYIAQFPAATANQLKRMRELVLATVPDAVESISYAMPGYKYKKKPLVYFAGYARHIGFYPTAKGMTAFDDRLKGLKKGKGSIQFPLDEDLREDLIIDIILFQKKVIDEKIK